MNIAEHGLTCPVSAPKRDRVVLAHGGGGRLMHDLIQNVFLRSYGGEALAQGTDSAVLHVGASRVAFTTDSFVVHPLFFPGGDIGSLAVYGTVNDLAMVGARPLALSCSVILEEGLSIHDLERIVASIGAAAVTANCEVVTGDTKVVEKGKGDGVFINTAGIGLVETSKSIAPSMVKPGDAVLISGDVGRHGIALMAIRENLHFDSVIKSDCGCLATPALALIKAGIDVHCMRDMTRGGLASAANEIAKAAGVSIEIDEEAVPVCDEVRGACEILGFDPLYVANEGRFMVIVNSSDADRALDVLKPFDITCKAVIAGHAGNGPAGRVTLKNAYGIARTLDMLSGEQLPRIC